MALRYSLLCALAAALLLPSAAAQNDLIITGVVDGPLSGGVPKAVEIYVVNDVADLSVYGFGSANNGQGTDGVEFGFTGSASAGDFLYAASEVNGFTTFFGFAPTFDAGSAASINGDDAVELFYDAAGFPSNLSTYTGTPTVVDTFGDINVAGTGQPWEYLDGWAYRVNGTGPDGTTFVQSNFTYSGPNALDGATTNASATTPFPIRTYSTTGTATGPVVSFATASVDGDEGASVTLTLSISYGAGAPDGTPVTATVAFDAANSTASAADFSGPTPASVTFSGNANGETQTVAVALTAGDGVEAAETAAFTVTVSGGSATVGSPSTVTVTINDTAALPVSTIAEARTAGPGTRVRVQGTVTRAMGSFTYFQDATAGLTIRQPSGAFFDAVAAGTIKPGTQIEVTGTLSEFRQLLQINEGDLESFTVLGTTSVPAAQEVTLAQLAANPESYEGELVTVKGVTFAESGTFAAGTNYTVSDASSATGPVVARVPNADDTSVDGTTIPARANVTAVVGQFDNTDPTAGYQLLLLDAGDIANAVAGEDDARAVRTLTVANPVQGSATVRFELAAPGRAQVALFDALGRRVAVLADGAVGAGVQTATLDAGGLATGVYVLRLQTEAGTVSRTLTVVR